MASHRPNSVFDGITWHLLVAMVVLAVVLAVSGSLALRLTTISQILMILIISVLTVAVAGTLVLGLIVFFVDAEPLERMVNGAILMLSPRKSASQISESYVGSTATVIEPFAPSEGSLRGRVEVGAEIWNAELDVKTLKFPEPGDGVEVIGRNGLVLVVRSLTISGDNAGAA